jgi:hypothetical protein
LVGNAQEIASAVTTTAMLLKSTMRDSQVECRRGEFGRRSRAKFGYYGILMLTTKIGNEIMRQRLSLKDWQTGTKEGAGRLETIYLPYPQIYTIGEISLT